MPSDSEAKFQLLSASMGHQVDTTLEKCQSEIKALQLESDKLKAEVEILKEKILTAGVGDHSSTSNKSEKKESPNIGTFSTDEVRNDKAQQKNSKKVYFTSPYSAPPGLPTGITELDLESRQGGIFMSAHPGNIKNDCFDINLNSWDKGVIHGVSCTWLELDPRDLDFQYGRFNTDSVHRRDKPQHLTSRRITFQRPYSSPPQVVVWLAEFTMGDGKVWHVRTYATDVTMIGFTIHFDIWGDFKFNSGHATWIAYPANKPGIFSGSFNTSEVRPSNVPQHHNSGFAKFGDGVFTTPPRVAMALNSFEIDCRFNARLRLGSPHVGVEGMNWTLVSRDSTILYSAGASFIALG